MFLFSLALYNVKNTRSVNVPEDVGGQETEYIIVPLDLNFLTLNQPFTVVVKTCDSEFDLS